jgi:hypothetical protein
LQPVSGTDSVIRRARPWKKLMACAEDSARAENVRELRLFTNEKMVENLAYYSALGYVETGRKPHERYQDSILVFMAKML